MVAALYVETGGVYFGLDDVEPWDEARDARLYDGPWPVVAHPPCNRWAVPLAYLNEARYGHKVGDDGGTFAAALAAVRRFGGVLEHPRDTAAWPRYELPKPVLGVWRRSLLDEGWVTALDQWAYGHPCAKRTWLYYIGPPPPPMEWARAPEGLPMVSWLRGAAWVKESGRAVISGREASATPPAFRDALLNLARSSASVAA